MVAGKVQWQRACGQRPCHVHVVTPCLQVHNTALISLDLSALNLTKFPPQLVRAVLLAARCCLTAHLSPSTLAATGPYACQHSRGDRIPARYSISIVRYASQGRLTGLTALNLSKNAITTLPPELGQLSRLQQINLRGNPLTAPYKCVRLAG